MSRAIVDANDLVALRTPAAIRAHRAARILRERKQMREAALANKKLREAER